MDRPYFFATGKPQSSNSVNFRFVEVIYYSACRGEHRSSGGNIYILRIISANT